ncbi:MAG: BMP family protein [Bacillota bacterium]
MKKNRILACLLVAVLAFSCFAFAGCGPSQGAPDQSGDGEKKASDYKMVLILPGPINDQSWNATNYAGLLACNSKLGTNIEYVENVQAADFESTFREYAERKYDLIMAAGSQFDEAAAAVAGSYPDTTFCVVNGSKADGANIAPIFPKEYEASYIASIIAGYVTENGNFATIGGFPNEPMEHLLDVYEKNSVAIAKEGGISGAKATRAYANSWDDVALGKQMAEQMIDNGADTLFVYANQVGLGAIEAAKAKGIKFIGFSSDQNSIDPNTVVASVKFDFETFYVWAVQQFIAGQLSGNMVHEAGIKENIFVPVYTDNISQEIKDAVDAGIKDFNDGKVDLKAMFAK